MVSFAIAWTPKTSAVPRPFCQLSTRSRREDRMYSKLLREIRLHLIALRGGWAGLVFLAFWILIAFTMDSGGPAR